MFTVTIRARPARGCPMIYFRFFEAESSLEITRQLTGDLPCKPGRNSEVMNSAPCVGTINLVMNNTL